MSKVRGQLTYANVMSTVAAFIALGGTSYAVTKLPKESVGERELKSNAVTSEKLRDGTVKPADLAPGTAITGPRGPRGAEGPAGRAGVDAVAAPTAEAWKPLPFGAGWTNYNVVAGPQEPEWENGAYRKDASGVVHVRGLVTFRNATPVQDSVIAELPPGYRPLHNKIFSVVTGLAVSTDPPGRIDVRTDGTIRWHDGANTQTRNFSTLQGISFEVD